MIPIANSPNVALLSHDAAENSLNATEKDLSSTIPTGRSLASERLATTGSQAAAAADSASARRAALVAADRQGQDLYSMVAGRSPVR